LESTVRLWEKVAAAVILTLMVALMVTLISLVTLVTG
jgi:hypothetical protein